MKANKKNNSILTLANPWSGNNNPIWLASTVSLNRNIEKFKFPNKLSVDRKKQIVSLISKDLLTASGLVDPYLIKAEEISVLEKEFLGEHFLSLQNYNQAQTGEGFVLDKTGEFLSELNMRDHLHLQLIDCKGELEATWSRLVKIETHVGKTLNYAFLPKFGFLTSDPTQCGTGLIVNVYLQLPGLIHSGTIDDILEKLADESLIIMGIQGSPTEIIGDVIVAQNNYTLGITEENIISSLRNFTTKIIVEEKSIRAKIKREDHPDFKDRVSRAFAILMHSYQIEPIEALNALSLLKLGVELNWIKGIENIAINEIFFNCRRAHLLSLFSEKISQEEILHKRTEYIHQALKAVKLMI